MFGAAAGRYAALVTVATQGFFLQARLPLPDMLMTFFITLALWQLWRMSRDGARGHHWLGFYGATALAFWSKGGAGFLPLAVALGWAVVNARDASWRRLGLLRGLALLVLLIAPWWLFGLRTDRVAIHGALVAGTSAALGGGRRRSEDLLASLPASLGEALVLAGGLGAMLVALGWGMQRARNYATRTWGTPPAAGTGLERSIVARAFAVAW